MINYNVRLVLECEVYEWINSSNVILKNNLDCFWFDKGVISILNRYVFFKNW